MRNRNSEIHSEYCIWVDRLFKNSQIDNRSMIERYDLGSLFMNKIIWLIDEKKPDSIFWTKNLNTSYAETTKYG